MSDETEVGRGPGQKPAPASLPSPERVLLDRLTTLGAELTVERDSERLIQRVTDEAAALVRAEFGGFEPAPKFEGERIVRSDDLTQDPRYGKRAPHYAVPQEHGVRSYLAVPVRSTQGELLGGLFCGHSRPGAFDEADERALAALAPIVGSALVNARLFESLRRREAELVRDVTDRKQFEARLRENELRYSQILDSIHDMVITRDEQGRITWANRAACCFYGTSLEQLRGTTGGSEDAARASGDIEVFSSGQVVERQEALKPAPQGERRIYHTVKAPLRNSDGEIKELVAVSRDITARKRELDTQRLLAQASALLGASMDYERTLRELVRAMVPTFADWAAVDLFDEAGEVKRLAVHHRDPQLCELALRLHDRYPPNLRAPCGLGHVLRTKQLEYLPEVSIEMIRATARSVEHAAWLEQLGVKSVICAPLVVGDQALGAISFVAAESKRRYVDNDVDFAAELAHRAAVAVDNARLYQQLREMTNTLEQRVEQRTAALTEINQELEAFSYTVSHDLRAPVRHIGGFVDLLREAAGDSLDAQALRYLSTIKNAALQMGSLIDGLLMFSRLGRAQLDKHPVGLSELLESVIRQVVPDLTNRRVQWKIGPLPVVLADATMLRLVMVNLIDNALKYTRGCAQARIEVGAKRQDQEYLIWVRDNGVGFDMQYVDKLFGVFQRLHSEEQFEGTGIGLASVRRIIVRHGGQAWAVSELGQGATFHFTLPIEEPEE